jgi:hypothetical protein
MSVFTAEEEKMWPYRQSIRYTVTVKDGKRGEDVNDWINQLNKKIGFALIDGLIVGSAKKQIVDQMEAHFHFIYNAKQGDCLIGKPTKGERVCSFYDKRTFYHELMHGLGFAHEQYHFLYPWDRTDPSIPNQQALTKWSNVSNSYYFADNVTKDKQNEKTLKQLEKNYGGNGTADAQLNKLYEGLMSGKWLYTKSIDPNSIMMYHESAKKILEGVNENRAEDMSNNDIEAVKAVYVEKNPGMWQCYPWQESEGKGQPSNYIKRKKTAGQQTKENPY